MENRNINAFIDRLEREDELIRIKSFVDPVLEITEITDRISKTANGGKAILFESTGTPFPVITNMLGSEKRICLALGVETLDKIGDQIHDLFLKLIKEKTGIIDKLSLIPVLGQIASWMPEVVSKSAPCQEIIMKSPDLNLLPILKCWPHDGGRFVTLPMVHTKDPETNARNLGMYRMQVIDSVTTGMHWQIHKTGARHFEHYKKIGKRMPVAVAVGGDPVYSYAATAPLPEGIDEYLLAGFLRKKKVKLVKCLTQDIDVPCDADFIIEGYVDPTEPLFWEGPFGDHTGFYSLEDWYPKFHVTCITHRANAIYPATVVGVPPQEDAYIAKATERIFLQPIKKTLLQEVADLDLPVTGVAHNLAIVSINCDYPGHAMKVFNSLWGAGQMMLNKIMVVTGTEIDVHNYEDVMKGIFRNSRFPDDVLISRGPSDVLDHASNNFAFGGKLGIDATSKDFEIAPIEPLSYEQEKCCVDILKETMREAYVSSDMSLHKIGIPVLIIKIDTNIPASIREFSKKIAESLIGETFRVVLWLNINIELSDIYKICWFASGSVDPARDCWFEQNCAENNSILNIDATVKTKEKDLFLRPWPNIVTMETSVIDKIDRQWQDLIPLQFIESPSQILLKSIINTGPVAYSNETPKK